MSAQPPVPVPAGARPPLVRRTLPTPLVWLIVAVLLVVIAFSFCTHRENPNEKLVRQVTEAVQRNDMSPVAKDFNAIQREQLTRGSVGRLSDQVAPLGKVKGVNETTPKDAAPRHHTFVVHFEKADWNAYMALDEDGKITSFYLRPPKT